MTSFTLESGGPYSHVTSVPCSEAGHLLDTHTGADCSDAARAMDLLRLEGAWKA